MTSINAKSAFLDIGYGARPVAINDDINAIHTNPAGLAFIANPEMSALYGRMYDGLSDDGEIGQSYFGFASPVKKYIPGALGFSWEELSLTEAYFESSFTLSYGTEVYKNMFGGIEIQMVISKELEKSKKDVQIFKNRVSKLEKKLIGKKAVKKKSAASAIQKIGEKKVYVVESGDTLRSVAKKV